MAGWDPTAGSGKKDGAGGRDAPGGIVWLENGVERPFEPFPERRRPWLEESSAWATPEGESGERPDDGDDLPALIWL